MTDLNHHHLHRHHHGDNHLKTTIETKKSTTIKTESQVPVEKTTTTTKENNIISGQIRPVTKQEAQPNKQQFQIENNNNNNNNNNRAVGSNGSRKKKRVRTSFKHQQLRIMKSHFLTNQNPDSKELKELSEKTGLQKRVLQVDVLFYLFFYFI